MRARRSSVRCDIGIRHPADVVGQLAGDPARLAEWFPDIVDCRVDGDQRVITTGAGLTLPDDAPWVAEVLRQAGYRSALVGKAHFETDLDPFLRSFENASSRRGTSCRCPPAIPPPPRPTRPSSTPSPAPGGCGTTAGWSPTSRCPPPGCRPLTADQVREVNAGNAVECELIDEGLGRVLARIAERGRAGDGDVVFTTDHGELQGDFGPPFKGLYHVDAVLRRPLVWRAAPSAGAATAVVDRPVGQLDVAPTFCSIAGIDPEPWMQGRPLPLDEADAATSGFERVLTAWDSAVFGVDAPGRTIIRPGWMRSTYLPGSCHDGSEGELYDLAGDCAATGQPVGRPGPAGGARRRAGRLGGPPTPGAGRAAAAAGPGVSRAADTPAAWTEELR